MVLFLFYAEEVRRQLITSVGRTVNKHRAGTPLKGGPMLVAVFQALEDQGLLSRAESCELQDLKEHRNKIAHQIHTLLGDIEVPTRRLLIHRYLRGIGYDYSALGKVRAWHGTCGNAWQGDTH